jgi:tetratricopeptide (TPR) repeat protein
MALREAQRDHRNVMVAFYELDCALCKSMDDSTYANGEVRKFLSHLVTVRLPVGADSAHTAGLTLRVREHPTAVFLRPDGVEIDRLVGYVGPAEFLTRARNILAGRTSIENLLAHEKDHLSDTPYLLDLAQKLYHQGRAADALARLARIPDKDPRNLLRATDEALFLHGRILSEQGRYQESIGPFTRLIEGFPDSDLVPDARVYRASSLLMTRGRGQEGVRELESIRSQYAGKSAGRWAEEQLNILRQRPPREAPG